MICKFNGKIHPEIIMTEPDEAPSCCFCKDWSGYALNRFRVSS